MSPFRAAGGPPDERLTNQFDPGIHHAGAVWHPVDLA
jgi:hypothetical protein